MWGIYKVGSWTLGQRPDSLSPLNLHCFEYIFPFQHHEVAVADAVVPWRLWLRARLLPRTLHDARRVSRLRSLSPDSAPRRQNSAVAAASFRSHKLRGRRTVRLVPPPRVERRFRFLIRPSEQLPGASGRRSG